LSNDLNRGIFTCYVPGLDARWISREHTPYLRDLSLTYPRVSITTLPNTELLPTLITGVYPHQHSVWQVRLKPEARAMPAPRLSDHLPAVLSTTLQCLRQFADSSYDLAAVPARRRRFFEQHRFKYTRRQHSDAPLARFGDNDSLFGLLGSKSHYHFTKDFGALDTLVEQLPTSGLTLEFLEMYAFDLCQHWNLDRPPVMHEALHATDAFIRRMHDRCIHSGVTMLILVDHGQEPVVGTIPLKHILRKTGVPEREYSYFIEVALARFWFHTDRARQRITDALHAISRATALTWRDMHAHHVCFEDDAYGELYLSADAGYIFFPHDFYQPVANMFLGLRDGHQRSRLLKPVHRGNHGYLPHYPSEHGYAILLDSDYRATRAEIELIDFAPSVLALLGLPQPPHMHGCAVFQRHDVGRHP
jgi:hypothetical protein